MLQKLSEMQAAWAASQQMEGSIHVLRNGLRAA